MPRAFKIAALAVGLAIMGLLSSCDLLFGGPSGQHYTISGTITAGYYSLSTPIAITISNGSRSYTTQVTLSGSGSGEYATYSITRVPAGTYSIEATFTCDDYSSFQSYLIDGVLQSSPALNVSSPQATAPFDVTESIMGLTIGGSVTIDVNLGDMG